MGAETRRPIVETKTSISKRMKDDGLKEAARAIREPQVRILSGQFRSDSSFRHDEGPTARERRLGALLLSLNLSRFYVDEVLDGGEKVPRIIYIQRGNRPAGAVYHTDMIADDSLRIVAVRKPKGFVEPPKVISTKTFEITAEAASLTGKMSALEVFTELKVDEWLNEKTWYELYEGRAGWRVAGSVRELPMPSNLSERQQQAILQQQEKAKSEFLTQRLTLWTLPAGFKQDVREIVRSVRSEKATKPKNARGPALEAETATKLNLQTEEGRVVLHELMEP